MKRISFKLIPGFERYRIYSDGRVWDSKREKFLSFSCSFGYLYVSLRNEEGLFKRSRVHRLVAQAFCYNDDPEHKDQVNHKDENKQNNNASNLEWCDRWYNMNYGTLPSRLSGNCGMKDKHQTEQAKAQISASNKGKHNTPCPEAQKMELRTKYEWLYRDKVVYVGVKGWATRKMEELGQIWDRGNKVC